VKLEWLADALAVLDRFERFLRDQHPNLTPIVREEAVPSVNYAQFEQAMRLRMQIVCMYGGYPRELCPVILGHSQGQEKALTYQFGGRSKSGLPPQGEWRCLWLSKVCDVELREGQWFAGSSHTRPQGCVEIVDLDVNPSSPYHPKRPIKPTDRSPVAR
jgi:hypothetical protein